MAPLRFALLVLVGLLTVAAPARADVVDDRVAAVSRGPGDLLLFARGDDGNLHVRSGLDGTWASLGVPVSSGPAAAVRGDGTVEVVARAPDRTLTHASLRGSTWTAWGKLGGTVLSAPALVARRGTNLVDLFVRGDDSGLFQRTSSAAGAWGPGEALGGPIFSAPTAVSRRPGYLDVYVQGVQDAIFVKNFDGGAWGPYFETPGGGRTNAAPFAVLTPDGDHLIMVRGFDGALFERRWMEADSAYGPYTRIDPRPLSTGPSAAVAGDGSGLHVFARDGADVLVRTFVPGSFGSWRSLGPVVAPAAPQPPAPPPAPVGGGEVSFDAGLSCTPRGQRMKVSVAVRKRSGRRKPKVTRVVFYYRKGKRKVARSDRRAPYRQTLRVDLEPGTYRVYARIEYRRGRKTGRKTVSRRFAVCA